MLHARIRLSRERLIRLTTVVLLACLPAALLLAAGPAADVPAAKVARGPNGMVASSTPYATAAGVRILEEGGNAIDAAVAAAFALMVTDPPMTSIGGRTQILIALSDGRVIGIDGSTWTPAEISPLAGEDDNRSGYQVAPVPGNPAALAQALERYGTLPLARVLQPAIELAEDGFAVTPTVAAIWGRAQDELARDPGAARNCLKPDGSAYAEGEVFRHPRLAAVLRALAELGPDVFYRGALGAAVSREMKEHGGFVRAGDLESYRPLPSVLVRLRYRDYEIVTPARYARGSALAEMLTTLRQFPLQRGQPSPEEVELLVRTIAETFADRPSILEPIEPAGPVLDPAATEEFARRRAERIRELLHQPLEAPKPEPVQEVVGTAHETTHLSVMDAAGNAMALTTSIGPVFGARVASPELGFLYAHSYRLDERPLPHQRDYTEMTPTIVLHRGKPVLALGAAGGVRIPGAVLQVLSNVIDRGFSLEEAVAAPRVFCRRTNLELHDDFPLDALERLRQRGFEIELRSREADRHLGRVHAVGYHPETGEFIGVADPAYDGAAAGPQSRAPKEP